MISEPHVSATDEELDNISQLLYDTATVIQKDFGTGWYKTVENTNDVSVLINELLEHYDNITSFTKWVNELTGNSVGIVFKERRNWP